MAKKDLTQEEVSTALVHAEPMTDQTALMTFESEEALLEQGFETEIFHKITEGDMIYGLFIGRGPDIELKQKDEKTGKQVIIPSWKIRGLGRDGKEVGVVMQIPGKYEINKFLRSHTPGNTLVGIKFLGRVQIGVNQVTKFATMFKVDANREASGPSEIEYEAKLKAEAEATARAQAAAK
jgi:hypothetical protein